MNRSSGNFPLARVMGGRTRLAWQPPLAAVQHNVVIVEGSRAHQAQSGDGRH